MSGPVLGIDLGTTNSAVAVADGREARVLSDDDGRRLIPSVVSFHPDGSILVGHDARERRLVDAANTVYSIKRLIGRPFQSNEVQRAKERVAFGLEATAVGGVQVRVRRGTFALPEISAMVLRHLRGVAESALGQPCQRAVITVPANFNELQRSATQAAGKVAGLEVMRILNEPTAATLAYGYAREKAETIAVYDLGGGTFDLTILDLDKDVFEVVSTAGDTFLGGDDIDILIAERMALQCLKQHRYDPKQDGQTFERLRAAGEWTKCQLSAVQEVEVTIEELLHDVNGRAVNFQFRMSRAELDELARPLIARSFDVVNDALRSAGRRPKEIKSVVLVGGSTRMPLVRQMVADFFHREPQTDIDPDLVVAQGAAIHAFTLAGDKKPAPLPTPSKALARVALKRVSQVKEPVARKQPAFAPEDPRDLPAVEEPTRIAPDPREIAARTDERARVAPDPRAPRPEEAKRVAQVPLRRSADDRPARRVGSTTEPGTSPRPGTSPFGKPAQPVVPKPAAPATSSAPLDFDFEDAPTRIGAYPEKRSSEANGELSQPFVEPPSSVAVVRTQAVGVGAPTQPERVRARKESGLLLDLDDPLAAQHAPIPAPRPPREPTVPIGTGPKARPLGAPPPVIVVGNPPVAPAAPPPAPAAPPPAPERRPSAAERAATLALEPSDISPVTHAPLPPERPAPPPSPAARAPDRDKIQAALFGGKPKPFGDALPLPDEPPRGPTNALPEPIAAPSPQALAPRQASVAMPERAAPLLMDVTPLALGLETAGGYAQHLVSRNAPIPTEKTRVFSTARDDQTEVEVRICQGDSNLFNDNQALGAITLSGLRKARRGVIRIEVTFMIDASGILDVKATDLDTKRAQALRIALRGGLDNAEVEQMRQRQERELFPAQR